MCPVFQATSDRQSVGVPQGPDEGYDRVLDQSCGTLSDGERKPKVAENISRDSVVQTIYIDSLKISIQLIHNQEKLGK